MLETPWLLKVIVLSFHCIFPELRDKFAQVLRRFLPWSVLQVIFCISIFEFNRKWRIPTSENLGSYTQNRVDPWSWLDVFEGDRVFSQRSGVAHVSLHGRNSLLNYIFVHHLDRAQVAHPSQVPDIFTHETLRAQCLLQRRAFSDLIIGVLLLLLLLHCVFYLFNTSHRRSIRFELFNQGI